MATSPSATARSRYYEGPDLVEPVFRALGEAGLDTSALDVDDLASLDEFHALGRAATVAVAELSELAPGMRLLDAGAGIGGPSRYLAARHGVEVVALDATERFCRLNERLCRATGLGDRVQVVLGDATAMPLGDGSFDRAWTQALIQNVADKAALLRELHRVLVPGGTLSMFEVLSRSTEQVHFPVPWGDGPQDSFLVGAHELRELAESAGFAVREWIVGTAAAEAIGRAAAAVPKPRHGVDLSLLMPSYQERMEGVGRNLAEQRIELAIAVLTAS
jgi:sarcosine/dimethylglycine N-methyltransferase